MPQSYRVALLTKAAVAALPVLIFTSAASAQYRLDTGRANDANNRIGSGGYNNSHDITNPVLGTNTQILTGNTTGLGFFHGNANIFDPNVSQASSETARFDAFNAISSPINYAQRSTGAPLNQPFYSTATYTPTSGSINDNFVRSNNNVGLTPAPTTYQQPNDTRLGVINAESPQSLAPPPGELALPGAVDTTGNPTLTTLSPLYGVRDWRSTDSSDQYFLSRYTNASNSNGLNPTDSSDSPSTSNNAANGNRVSGSTGGAQGPLSGSVAGNRSPGAGLGSTAFSGQVGNSAAVSGSVQSQAISQQVNATAVGGGGSTAEGLTQRVVDLPAPAQQSSQIAALEQRLDAKSQQPMNAAAAGQLYNDQLNLRKQIDAAKQSNAPGGAAGSAAGGTPPAYGGSRPQVSLPPETAPEPKAPLKPILTGPAGGAAQEPYVITSLATGLNSPELTKIMKSAEEQMRRGKFNDALDQYDTAEQTAPNNPFTRLGRSFAELGASYYSRSDSDLRKVIVAEPALLAGRYDLNGFLGEDRLQFITKDLQDISASEKSSVSSEFLLAFISHNTGNDTQAATYLDSAQQRENGQPDGVLNLMRKIWNLADRR